MASVSLLIILRIGFEDATFHVTVKITHVVQKMPDRLQVQAIKLSNIR